MSAAGTAASKIVTFTIDGRPFTLDHAKQTASSLLELSGLDPAGYDLGEVRPGNEEPKVFKDDQPVHVKDGDRFVTIRQNAPVA
jgi:hypothetical protein